MDTLTGPQKSLRELHEQPSKCWDRELDKKLIRFWTDDGDLWCMPFFNCMGCNQDSKNENVVSIGFPLGTIEITGPMKDKFLQDFCDHYATNLKADGTDILSVRILRGKPKEEPESAEAEQET